MIGYQYPEGFDAENDGGEPVTSRTIRASRSPFVNLRVRCSTVGSSTNALDEKGCFSFRVPFLLRPNYGQVPEDAGFDCDEARLTIMRSTLEVEGRNSQGDSGKLGIAHTGEVGECPPYGVK